MTIRAQQSQVSGVRRPVFESSRPYIHSLLGLELASRVYMVNIKGAKIAKAAFSAFTAELFYQGNFAFPISRTFVNAMSVFIPIISQTIIGAKAIGAFLSAGFALARFAPAMSEIARHPAKLSPFVLLRRFAAMLASSHGTIIPKYFEIACERIENAQRQLRMFA